MTETTKTIEISTSDKNESYTLQKTYLYSSYRCIICKITSADNAKAAKSKK